MSTRKLIWVRTPKCAGSSIASHIKKKRLPIDTISWGLVSEYLKKNSVDEFEKALKFTVVRNPFSRFVSSYLYAVRKGWLNKNLVSFRDFARIPWKDLVDGPYPSGTVIPVNRVYQHTRPLTEHLSYDLGHMDYIDRYVKFEGLISNLNQLLGDFGISFLELKKLNASNHSSYEGYYDLETKKVVQKKFAADFEMFQYNS